MIFGELLALYGFIYCFYVLLYAMDCMANHPRAIYKIDIVALLTILVLAPIQLITGIALLIQAILIYIFTLNRMRLLIFLHLGRMSILGYFQFLFFQYYRNKGMSKEIFRFGD